MMSTDTLPAKPHPSIHALASAMLSFLFIVICFSGISPGQETRLQVVNKTRSLEITSMKRDGSDVHLTLRNFYNKPVTAFEISLPRPLGNNGIAEDRFKEFEEVLPGDSYETTVTLPYQVFNIGEPHQQEIVVSAVLFKDRTSEGDTESAARLEARQSGERVQLARIIPLLQKTLESSDADLPAALQSLKVSVSALSCEEEGSGAMDILRSHYPAIFDRVKDILASKVFLGLKFNKDELLSKIYELEHQSPLNRNLSLKQQLTSILQEYEKKLAVL